MKVKVFKRNYEMPEEKEIYLMEQWFAQNSGIEIKFIVPRGDSIYVFYIEVKASE